MFEILNPIAADVIIFGIISGDFCIYINPIDADVIVFGIISGDFCIYIDKTCCIYSLESPQGGDSNEYTQYTFTLKKIEKISLLSPLSWHYNQPSLA